MPSATLNYNLNDDVKLRFSYARALGRPNPGDLRIAQVSDPTTDQQRPTVNGGNPQLKARKADNFDISLEYYFDGSESMAFIAVFHKDIEDDIFTFSTTGTFNGQTATLNIPQNAESSELTGFEIGFIKSRFESLPGALQGLGVSLNYAYIDGKQTVLDSKGFASELDFIFEQPDEILNAALFYQQDRFEGKLAYSYTSAYNRGFAGDPGYLDQFARYETLDLQLRFDVSDNWYLIGEVRNLTDQPLERRTGPNQVLLNDLSEFGLSYFLGVSYRL